MMRLWILQNVGHVDYDSFDSFIVRADTEDAARTFAANSAGDERSETWLDRGKSTCEPLTTEGEPGIVLGSFNAG